MRILTITNLYPNPFEPNRATFNRQQLRALSALTPVRVVSPIAWTDEMIARHRKAGEMPRSRRVTLDGITVDHPRYLFTPKVLRAQYGRFYKWSVSSSVARAVEEFKPDMIFAPWAYPDGWAAVKLGEQYDLPVVIKVHGCDVLFGLTQNPEKLPGTIEALHGAEGVVAVSCDLLKHVGDLGVEPSRIRVVYDGIDGNLFYPEARVLARKRLNLPVAQKALLFVGSLVEVKGLDVLIDACVLLRERGLHFDCHLVGDGPLRETLQRRVAEVGMSDRIRFQGQLPHDQLGDWFRAANVFVLPSRSEGVPCVLLEAMACGTAFVASAVGGIPEVSSLGKASLVPPEDPEALAKAIDRQLTVVNGHDPLKSEYVRDHSQAARELLTFLNDVQDTFTVSRAQEVVAALKS